MKEPLKYKFARFMQGRYGPDSLYYGLLILYFVLFVINIIVESEIIALLMSLTLVWLLFRLMSKNHYKRQRENAVFLKIIRPFKAFFTTNYVRIRDIRSKRYRTCKRCKAVMRLPIKKGTHTVRCAKCGNEFKVKILF